MPPNLSIIIVNWNVREMLADCLRALPDAAGEWWERAEVVVVDNASADGSVEMLGRDFPGARVVALKRNLGFSGGNNVGIGAAQGKLLLLLNPDTLPRPHSIARLCDYMEANPDCGIAGPRLLNADGSLQPSRRRSPTFWTALVESTPLQGAMPRAPILQRFYMRDKPDGETQDVGWLSGAALMCRREALAQVGLFDTGYFMFSEEVDLCRRVSQAGWRISYVPQSEITHYGGGSTEQDVPSRHINFNTAKARYFRKHHGKLAGHALRLYLLSTYVAQAATEAAKLALQHKPALRRARLRLYAQVLKSGLRPHRSVLSPQSSVLSNDALLITGEYPPARGGVGDYTCRLGLALGAAGVGSRVLTEKASVVSGRWSVVGDTVAAERGVRASAFPLVVLRVTARRVLAALRATRSRTAHIQYQTGAFGMRPTVNLLPLFLRLVWRGQVVVTFHDLRAPYLFPKAGPLREWANRLMALCAHAVIATNPEDAARLREWGARRVELIPIGSNIRNSPPPGYSREAWRASRGIGPNTTLLAYFGFLNSSKGLDDLLRALHTLRDEGDYRLLMVGGGLGSSDPTNRATSSLLDNLAGELGVRDRLIWTGYLSPQEVSASLLAAEIAVLPYADGASFRRGSLLAVLEHGLPLITTAPAGQWSVVSGQWSVMGEQSSSLLTPHSSVLSPWPEFRDRENALLVPPGDSRALAARIRELAADRALRAKLAHGSLQIGTFFAWDGIAIRHRRVYPIGNNEAHTF